MKGRLALLTLFVLPAVGHAALLNFDDVSAPKDFANADPLRDYHGLHFSGPGPLDGGAIASVDGNFGIDAHSGENFLAFNFNSLLKNGGVPSYPERVTFDDEVTWFSIWVAGGSGEEDPVFFLKAYDDADNQIAFDTTLGGAKDWSQMTVATDGIKYVEFYLLEEGDTDKAWVADDLFYLRPVPEPATMTVLGLGGLALAARRRRSKK